MTIPWDFGRARSVEHEYDVCDSIIVGTMRAPSFLGQIHVFPHSLIENLTIQSYVYLYTNIHRLAYRYLLDIHTLQ